VDGEIRFKESPNPAGERDDPDFRFLSIGSALAVDPDLLLLPLDVLRGEAAKLGHSEAGVEECPDDELLLRRLAGVGELVGLLGSERFTDVLIRHRPSCFVRV